jgi:hypothetical protein
MGIRGWNLLIIRIAGFLREGEKKVARVDSLLQEK